MENLPFDEKIFTDTIEFQKFMGQWVDERKIEKARAKRERKEIYRRNLTLLEQSGNLGS